VGNPGLVYGLDFTANGTSYEVRAQRVPGLDYDAAGGASFGLFKQDAVTGLYTHKVATLHGGYGTTGAEVVFSLPLRDIGLQDGGRLTNATAFTAVGSYELGVVHILDSLRLR